MGAGREVWTSLIVCLLFDCWQLSAPVSSVPLCPTFGWAVTKAYPSLGAHLKFKPRMLRPTPNHSKNQGHLLLLSLSGHMNHFQPSTCPPLPRKSPDASTAVFSCPFGACVASSVSTSNLSAGVGVHPPSTKGHNNKAITLALLLGLGQPGLHQEGKLRKRWRRAETG